MAQQAEDRAVSRPQDQSSLSQAAHCQGTAATWSHPVELSVLQNVDFQPSFLQGNSEVTIHADLQLYVQTGTQDDVLEVLQDKGIAVLCGPPGSGKTTLATAVLRHFRNREFKPYILTNIEDWHQHIGRGRRSIVLMDGIFGHARVKQERQDLWEAVRGSVTELTGRGDCRLVVTVYPHILRELQRLERGSTSPLLDPAVILHMPRTLDTDVKDAMLRSHLRQLGLDSEEQQEVVDRVVEKDVSGPVFPWCCAHMLRHWAVSEDPTDIFTIPAVAYVALVAAMLHDRRDGETVAAVLALAMRGLGCYLQDPRPVRPHLRELRLHPCSEYTLEEQADLLKGFILSQSGYGFVSRVLYDAVGLALGRSFSLPVLLKVCDVDFFVQYIQKEFHPFSVPVGRSSTTEQTLMRMVYDFTASSCPEKVCQSALFYEEPFLQGFDLFVRAESGRLQRFLSASDEPHRLTALYWSAWNCHPHLSEWCVKAMEVDWTQNSSVLDDEHLKAAVASALLHSSRHTPTHPRGLLEQLSHMKIGPAAASERVKVHLPLPAVFLRKETKRKLERLKTRLRSPGLCYLDDPSLPIPASLLSVSVTEDAVSVELCSQHWYLALRLLADREVDQTDRDGNTLLHIAAHKGNLEAITLAVKSGALLTQKNNKGVMPYQLAQQQRRWTYYKIASPPNIAFGLFPAVHGGDEVTVKTLLCYGSSVKEQDSGSRTALFVACEQGQGIIADLFIELGADVNAKGYSSSMGTQTALHHACRNGLSHTAELLVKHGADINARNSTQQTPLHCACQCESPTASADITRLLLDAGADVNAADKNSKTPLFFAVRGGHTQVVSSLIGRGADLNRGQGCSWTLLHEALDGGRTDIALLMIDSGADVNAQDQFGMTPLHSVVLRSLTEALTPLIDCGANINARDTLGRTSLHCAPLSGSLESLTLLIGRGADLNAKNQDGTTPLHLAYMTGTAYGTTPLHLAYLTSRPDMMTQLVEAGAETGRVHQAVVRGDVDALMTLLQQGADVNQHDTSMGCSPLHAACLMGHTDIVTCLLQHGAQVNAVDLEERTPLHQACIGGHTQVARLLVDRGADVNARDMFQSTLLHETATRGNTEITLWLIESGARVNAGENQHITPYRKGHSEMVVFFPYELGANINAKYETPLHQACRKGHTETALCLIQHGANVNARDAACATPLHRTCSAGHTETVQRLVEQGASLGAKRWYRGELPLHDACENGRTDTARCLVERGADVNATADGDATPLHSACVCGHNETVECLLQLGASMSARSRQGGTPLHTACRYGRAETARSLIAHGADVNATAEDELTPLHMACERGHAQTVQCLLQHGARVYARSQSDKTPLDLARKWYYFDVVTLLVKHGAFDPPSSLF